MARRTGRPTGAAKKKNGSPEYGQASAKQYQQQTRDRLKQQKMRTWTIRLIIFAILGVAAWKLGPGLVSTITQRGREAKYELQKTQQGVQGANDKRSGANFNPDE